MTTKPSTAETVRNEKKPREPAEAEKARADSYFSLVANSPDGVLVHDGDRILYANQAAAGLTGATNPEELVGRTIYQFFHSSSETATGHLEADLAEAFAHNHPVEMKILRADGQYIDVELYNVGVEFGGKPAFQTIMWDISGRAFREAEFVSAKAAADIAQRSKESFLANMSHELRTPLNAIIGFSEIMQSGIAGKLEDKQAEYLDLIHESGRQLMALINDILELSKSAAGTNTLEETTIDLWEMITDVVRFFSVQAVEVGVDVIVKNTEPARGIRGDQRMIRQVLIALLSNGIKFTPKGGRVVIAVEAADAALVLRVSDSGIGIDEKEIPKALSPFEQLDDSRARKYEGTGLGLPLVKALSELHDATIEISGQIDRGTDIKIQFPPERVVGLESG